VQEQPPTDHEKIIGSFSRVILPESNKRSKGKLQKMKLTVQMKQDVWGK
jgi:hypothetical protein